MSSTIAKLFEESPQAKVVQDSLRAEFGPRLQQLVAQEQALKARNEKYQKDLATMAADQRTKAEKDLRDGARELERKKAELQDDSNAKRQEEMNKLQRLLIGEVREYAKAQNFDIVIAEGVHLCHAHRRHHGCGSAGACRRARRSRPQAAAPGAREAAREALRRAPPGDAAPAAMTVTLGELAVRFGCELRGDPAVTVDSVAALSQAGPRSITFLANPKYVAQLAGTRAGAVILDAKSAAGLAGARAGRAPIRTPRTRASRRCCTRIRR